jgi:hypothetical protein
VLGLGSARGTGAAEAFLGSGLGAGFGSQSSKAAWTLVPNFMEWVVVYLKESPLMRNASLLLYSLLSGVMYTVPPTLAILEVFAFFFGASLLTGLARFVFIRA